MYQVYAHLMDFLACGTKIILSIDSVGHVMLEIHILETLEVTALAEHLDHEDVVGEGGDDPGEDVREAEHHEGGPPAHTLAQCSAHQGPHHRTNTIHLN